MKSAKLVIPAAALAVATVLGVPAAAAAAGSPSAASGASSSASSPAEHRNHPGHGELAAMNILATLTGTDAKTLAERYPQKTAWQIARQLGKLDALKQEFLSQHKQLLDKLVSEGKITKEDNAKMYADLQKRVAAIDGNSTVILGRPGYRPQRQ